MHGISECKKCRVLNHPLDINGLCADCAPRVTHISDIKDEQTKLGMERNIISSIPDNTLLNTVTALGSVAIGLEIGEIFSNSNNNLCDGGNSGGGGASGSW